MGARRGDRREPRGGRVGVASDGAGGGGCKGRGGGRFTRSFGILPSLNCRPTVDTFRGHKTSPYSARFFIRKDKKAERSRWRKCYLPSTHRGGVEPPPLLFPHLSSFPTFSNGNGSVITARTPDSPFRLRALRTAAVYEPRS